MERMGASVRKESWCDPVVVYDRTWRIERTGGEQVDEILMSWRMGEKEGTRRGRMEAYGDEKGGCEKRGRAWRI